MALDYTIIGERLKKARLEKNLTQEQLAEQIDVSIAFLSRVERGSSHINLKRLTQICNILGISEGLILNGASEDSSDYLNADFKEILEKASPDKQKLIYKIAEIIVNEDRSFFVPNIGVHYFYDLFFFLKFLNLYLYFSKNFIEFMLKINCLFCLFML